MPRSPALARVSTVNPDGNKRLTAAVGVLLLAPVLLEIATVLLGVHTFMSWHVFVGIALIPLVVLKLATTGLRFVRYYTRSRAYVAHGPPQPAMRLLAPLLVVATVVLFGSGVAMGLLHGHALQVARRLHGPASVIWLLLLGLHVLVYLGRALRDTADEVRPDTRPREDGAQIRIGDRSRLRPGARQRTRSRPAPVGQHPARPRPERGSVRGAEPAVFADAAPAAAVLHDRQRHPHGGRLDASHRPAVRDHEDASVAGMALGNPSQRVKDPVPVLLCRLADELDAVALRCGQALPGSPVLLSQVGVEHGRQPEFSADDLGRLAGTRKIAGVDRLELLAVELLGELLCLTPTEVAQRPVGVALKAPLGIPVGLAVANEKQSRHDGLR